LETPTFPRKPLKKIFSPGLGLLLLAFLAYGIFLPWMGFYWDDWPWVWRFHVGGVQAIREIDAVFRPLAGIVLWAGALVAGEDPLRWQIYNLVIRWLGGVALWWALRQIWPQRNEAAFWVAGLYLVYPGFGQQFVAVNSSRHLFALIPFFLSFGLMGKAVRKKSLFGWHTWLAVALSLVTMFTTEYFYGLELIRVGFLWILLEPEEKNQLQKMKTAVKSWLPYLIPVMIVFIWRYSISQEINYQIGVVDRFQTAPWQTLLNISATALRNFILVTLGAWKKLLEFPQPEIFGTRKTILYWGLIIISGFGTFLFARNLPKDRREPRWNIQAIVIGVAAITIGGLPFWATDLLVDLGFPNDRLTLPMMAGVGLLTFSLIDLLIKSWILKISVLVSLVALSTGVQAQNAVTYQEDWKYQVAFFRQIIWRAPELKPGTAILTTELPLRYTTDNSLTAPLNWIYAPDHQSGNMEFAILYLDQRIGGKISALEEAAPITIPSDQYPFESSTSNSLVLYHAPPACVRILDPVYDQHLPGTPGLIDEALPFSNLTQINPIPASAASLPESIFGPTSIGSWCYYFEKADLARQQGDWTQVAQIGDIAFQLSDSPNHASERVPFIEGYAHVGEWETATKLTLDAIKIDRFTKNMLCDTWTRIAQDIPDSNPKNEAIQTIETQLTCNSE
jgi:hypothetical protein